MGEEEKVQPKNEPKKEGPGNPMILIGILLFLVVALGTSLVIVLMMLSKKPAAIPLAAQYGERVKNSKPGILVPLGGDVIVNLANEGGGGFLKVNAVLEVDTPKAEAEVKARAPQIRDLMIGILRLETVEKISEKEGIDHIRSEIITNINNCLYEGRVINIYFSDFIMQ